MKFSKRTHWNQNANAFYARQQELRKANIPLLDLTVSNPTDCGFHYLKPELLNSLIDPRNLSYNPDPRGLLTCRQAIAHYYKEKGINLDPEQILVTASTSEAYSFIFKLLFEPEDELLVSKPSYPLLDYLAEMNDVTITHQTSEKTKAVLRVHPNNPTGHYVTESERQKLNEECQKNDWALMVDEVFLDYALENPEKTKQSFTKNTEVLAFTLSGISKVLGLPQMKLSWIVVSGPEEKKKEALTRLEILADTFLSTSVPIQNALPNWMNHRIEIQNEILTRLKNNYEWLKKQSYEGFTPIEGGWCIPLRLPGNLTDEAWAIQLLEKAKTIVHPGYFYDFSEGSWIVVSLLVPEKIFQEGMTHVFREIKATEKSQHL